MKKGAAIILLFFTYSVCYCQIDTLLVTDDLPLLEIKQNEPFMLKFLACHSCGFNWSLVDVDTLKIQLISVTSKHTSGREDIKGGSVYEYWKFNITTAGYYVLEFIYKRPWLKENERISSVELFVN